MDWEEYFADEQSGRDAEQRGKKRTVTVGWTVRAAKASAMWSAPQPFSRQDSKSASAKSIQRCPAAIDFDRRHFIIPCPVDLTLKFARQSSGQLTLVDADGDASAVRPTGLREMVVLHPQNEWRHPERPIVQMVAPYIFVADDPCFVVQTAPYLHYFPEPRPGVQMGGRFPIHIWPRPLSWGFEWHDWSKPLVLKRGEPWFYVAFETENPSARVRLVEQEKTPELDAYVNSIVDVSNFVNKTYALFGDAQRARPATLVRPKS